ncbi:MAG: hypothetical protein AB7S75_13200 [Desulfococcaceae bacterium]
MLTHDPDFGELLAASQAELPGVIIFRLHNMRSENIKQYLNGIIIRRFP